MAIHYGDGTIVTSGQSFVQKLMMIAYTLFIILFWIIYYFSLKSFANKIAAYFNITNTRYKQTLFMCLLLLPIILKFVHHYSRMPWHNSLLYDASRSLFLVFISLW